LVSVFLFARPTIRLKPELFFEARACQFF